MPNVELPEREVFDRQVKALEQRIDGITKKNTMAGLLNNNFKKWLSGSSMSALTLTEELDTDTNGFISGGEFATLLGRMTGERPPDWVTEIVFSFVNATPSQGIPLHDWYAFLAASGLDIPDELFKQKVVVTGVIAVLETTVMAGEPLSVSVSFNSDVVGYELNIASSDPSTESVRQQTLASSMDRPDFDDFILDMQTPGQYTLELMHLGQRLDTAEVWVVPRPEPVQEEEEPPEAEPHREDEMVDASEPVSDETEHRGENGFEAFVSAVESVKLRSEAQDLIAQAPSYHVHGVIHSVSRTLLGAGPYRNGHTVHCESEGGVMFRVMLKPLETPPAAGGFYHASVALHDWDVALKQMICLEV
jgi:hypothetical protein